MSALAIAFKKVGWHVTGSDAGFFPPVSTTLKNHEIDFYPGWHPEKMTVSGVPDLVVVGNVASSTNPEWRYVQENKIPYKSYPETIAEFFVKKNSIVCAGTYGKTTTSALLSWILTENNYKPSYMFGGLAVDQFDSAAMHDSEYSVLEGDEYKSARWDNSPKFSHYSPTHLLLTGLEWDHADIYPTEQAYMKVFSNLVAKLPKNGMFVACIDNASIRQLVRSPLAPTITYGNESSGATVQYTNVEQSSQGLAFTIRHNNTAYSIQSKLLGLYQAANITGVFALAAMIGIPAEYVIASIASFGGLKRRLEKRYDGTVTVFDDIAHSPAKAKSVLETLRTIYPEKIIAIFEPNTGNRRGASAPSYDHAFASADEVIIPELTKIKRDENDSEEVFDSARLAEIISSTHPQARSIPHDNDLIQYLYTTAKTGDVAVFLGSHGFRGMIDEYIHLYS